MVFWTVAPVLASFSVDEIFQLVWISGVLDQGSFQ